MRNSEIKKIANLLQQALNAAQGSGLSDTRKNIQKAIENLEISNKKKQKHLEQNQSQKWWDSLVSGVANGQVTGQSAMRSLEDLNKMIGVQEKTIDDIEKQVSDSTSQDVLIKD